MATTKRKIFFSTSNIQPMPPVLGGATESLIQILVEENEKREVFEFHILSRFHPDALLLSKNYKNTKFHYYRRLSEFKWFDLFEIFFVIEFYLARFFSIIPSKKFVPRYYYYAYQLLRKHRPNYFVAEGGIYENYFHSCNVVLPENRYAHLHREVECNSRMHEIFPKAIAISAFVKQMYLTSGVAEPSDVHILRNVIDEAHFTRPISNTLQVRLRERLGISEDDFVICFCGRVVEEKGVIQLVNAYLESDLSSNTRLIIIGSPRYAESEPTQYWDELREVASKNPRIILTGFVDYTELVIYYSICSLCVVPSIWDEPVALVPLEAMTMGLPVIISDAGGMIEYEKNNCLIVVPRGKDFESNLRLAIEQIYYDKIFRSELGERGKARSADFSKLQYFQKFSSIFEG